jgi:hypothetical protein
MGGRHGRKLVPIRHGTYNGYIQHVRRKVPVDENDSCGCRAAQSAYQRERRTRLAG